MARHHSSGHNDRIDTASGTSQRQAGSIDLTGASRSEMLAGSLPDDPEARALVHINPNPSGSKILVWSVGEHLHNPVPENAGCRDH